MEITKFLEILGELSMHKQCVLDYFFSTHTGEPRNEAKKITAINVTLSVAGIFHMEEVGMSHAG